MAMQMKPCCAIKLPVAPRMVAPQPLKRASLAIWLAGTATTAGLVFSTPALATDLAMGQEVFDNNCAACHSGGNNSVQNEKTLRKAALEQYLTGGFNIEAIEAQVTKGKNAMPAWGDRLDEDDIKEVAAYVFDQASGDKW